MTGETVAQVLLYARRCAFEAIDITGGAPEMNPELYRLIAEAAEIVPRVMLRSNLTALNANRPAQLIAHLASHRVAVYASFPSP